MYMVMYTKLKVHFQQCDMCCWKMLELYRRFFPGDDVLWIPKTGSAFLSNLRRREWTFIKFHPSIDCTFRFFIAFAQIVDLKKCFAHCLSFMFLSKTASRSIMMGLNTD
ncbi:hypothetical protein A1353_14850 [Methylomonas methanica]|uniref:Uncharacterized protein n=1 Tax=Methylomonas methanica TaxID=421 RepID=A0A177MB33_METMH|nr:hypothetical protein A1353_14850 [Methylomonas methanica]